jgi:hypothetical protein
MTCESAISTFLGAGRRYLKFKAKPEARIKK